MDFLLEKKENPSNPNILLEDYRTMLANPEFHAFLPEHISFIERNIMVLESMVETMGESMGESLVEQEENNI